MTMNYISAEKVFVNRIEMLSDDSDELLKVLNRLYLHDVFKGEDLSENNAEYLKNLVESTLPTIEKLFDLQDEDGSAGNIVKTALFTAIMCIASRVYENIDPILTRDSMHCALDSGRFLMKVCENMSESFEERSAMLLAFAELLKTDYEIRNTYDHSMMAGMPQKMSRQKKYRIYINELMGLLSDSDKKSDVYMFALTDISLSDDEKLETPKKNAFDKICKMGDKACQSSTTDIFDKQSVLCAIRTIENRLLENDMEENDSSQLIKVIEYNTIGNRREKLSEDDIKILKDKLSDYERFLAV